MDSTVRYYSKAVRSYEAELFAQRDADGIISIMRKGHRWEVYDCDGTDIAFLVPSPSFVFALTDTWTKTGQPRHWGSDRVLARLREIDAWAKRDLIAELEEQEERVEKSRARHLRNEAEAFFADNRREFAKATNDVLTHSMDKTEKRRRIRDGNRERKHG